MNKYLLVYGNYLGVIRVQTRAGCDDDVTQM